MVATAQTSAIWLPLLKTHLRELVFSFLTYYDFASKSGSFYATNSKDMKIFKSITIYVIFLGNLFFGLLQVGILFE